MKTLNIDYKPIGNNGRVQLTARLGDVLIACEKVDLLRSQARDAFAAKLCASDTGIHRNLLDARLLALAANLTENQSSARADGHLELDGGSVVRPEMFHAADVSGIAVPLRSAFGGEARAKWNLYLRWHDSGKRERHELISAIELPSGARLMVHPLPGDPSPTLTPAWSAAARRAWLDGKPPPDPCPLFQKICAQLTRYLDFPPDTAPQTTALLALWIMFTYCYSAWNAVPYLCIGGPLGSGKSTLFGVLSQLVFRPLPSSNMTAPCLFRTLHEHGGVLLLDEAERLRDGSPEASELRSIMLSGYKVGSPARRLEKIGDGFRQVAFDVFGPKAIASIANPPEALASRCIKIMMFRAGPDSPKPRRRIDADSEIWQAIRDDLHALALEYGPTWLALSRRENVVPMSLAGRYYELWQPLLALASWIESHGAIGLVSLAQEHAVAASDDAHDDTTPDADQTLLRIVAGHVADGSQATLRAGDVLKRANELDPVTFSKWSPKGVANTLARYGLRTTKGRGGTGRTYAKVSLAMLLRIEAAYGLDLGLPSAHVPTRTDTYPGPAFLSGKSG